MNNEYLKELINDGRDPEQMIEELKIAKSHFIGLLRHGYLEEVISSSHIEIHGLSHRDEKYLSEYIKFTTISEGKEFNPMPDILMSDEELADFNNGIGKFARNLFRSLKTEQ